MRNAIRTRRLIAVVAWGLFAFGLYSLLRFILVIIAGGPWTVWIHAHNPDVRLLEAMGSFAGWFTLLHGRRYTRAQWLRLAGKLFLCGVGLGIGVLGAEIALRALLAGTQRRQANVLLDGDTDVAGQRIRSSHPLAYIVQPSACREMLFELRPELDMLFGHRTLRTNRDGMRADTDYPRARSTRSVRIVGLGDSGMFGWNVDQGEEYMAVLETLLNEREDGVLYEVLNFGTPGYNTQLEVAALICKGLEYDPDIVILAWCENDFQLPFFIPQHGQWRRRDVFFLKLLLFDRVRFADTALSLFGDLRDYDEDKIPREVLEGAGEQGVRRAFRDLKALADEHGFHVLVFGPLNNDVLPIVQEANLPYYNTWERIGRDEYPAEYAVHFMHPRPEGHRVLAEHIARELEARDWLRPRDGSGGEE